MVSQTIKQRQQTRKIKLTKIRIQELSEDSSISKTSNFSDKTISTNLVPVMRSFSDRSSTSSIASLHPDIYIHQHLNLSKGIDLTTNRTITVSFTKIKIYYPLLSTALTCSRSAESEEESNTRLSSINPSFNVVTSNKIRIQVPHHSNTLQTTRLNEVEEEGNTRPSFYNSNYTEITSTKTEMKLHKEIVNTK